MYVEPSLPSSPSDFSYQPFVESFAGLSVTGKRESVKIVNSMYAEILHAKEAVDKALEEVRNDRRLMSIPIVLIPKLIAIYKRLLEPIDPEHAHVYLESAQKQYKNALKSTLDNLKESLYGSIALYKKDLEERCENNFKGFVASHMKIDAGCFKLDADIKELERVVDRFHRKTVVGDMSLHHLQSSLYLAQLNLLKNMKEMENKFIEDVYKTTAENEFYEEYSRKFCEVNAAAGMSDSNEITFDIIERAQAVCAAYHQFHPKIVYSTEEYFETLNIRSLKLLSVEDISQMYKTVELEFNKENIAKIIEELEGKLITFELNEMALEGKEEDYISQLEGYRTTLAEIDEYACYREQRDTASENEYRDIWHVCKKGSIEAIQEYHKQIEGGLFDINTPHTLLGLTLLHFAVLRGDPEIVEYLMEKEASAAVFSTGISREIPFFYTPLHLAAAKCSLEIVQICLLRTRPNIYTQSNAPAASYSPLQMVIKPKLLFQNQSEAYGEVWQLNAAEVVNLLLREGAEVSSAHTTSAFHLVIDEFITVCRELNISEHRMIGPANNRKQAMRETFISIIDVFLSSPSLLVDDLKKSVEVLSVSFKEKRMGESEKALLQKLVNHAHFSTKQGEAFLSNLSIKKTTDGTPQIIKNGLNRGFSVRGNSLHGSQKKISFSKSTVKTVSAATIFSQTSPADEMPTATQTLKTPRSSQPKRTTIVMPSLVDLKETSADPLQSSVEASQLSSSIDRLPRSPRSRIQSAPSLKRHFRPRSNDVHDGDQIKLQFKKSDKEI